MSTYTLFNTKAQIASSMGVIYSNPSGTKSEIPQIEVHNTNTTTESVVISLVAAGSGVEGTASDADKIYAFDVAANDTIKLADKMPYLLENQYDSIQASTTTASKVNITIKGFKVT